MADIGVIWAQAPSLQKLERELTQLLAERSAGEVLGISHSAAVVSSKQSGGIWGGGNETSRLEYSAVVLVRNGQAAENA